MKKNYIQICVKVLWMFKKRYTTFLILLPPEIDIRILNSHIKCLKAHITSYNFNLEIIFWHKYNLCTCHQWSSFFHLVTSPNLFHSTILVSFYTPCKYQETSYFSDVFREYKKEQWHKMDSKKTLGSRIAMPPKIFWRPRQSLKHC